MSKEVAKKESMEVSTEVTQWGTDVNVGKDLLLSKVLTMQAMSDLVTAGDAKIGEFRDSITHELLGDITNPTEFIPFHCRKMWDILESEGPNSQPEWVKSVPVVEDPTKPDYNDNWEWTVEENGKLQKRVRRLDFFCLLVSQLKAGTAMPVTLSFRSTSYKSGQILLNQMYVRNKMLGKSPASIIMSLSGEKVKNDKGTFIVTKVTPVRASDKNYELAAFDWFKLITKSNVIIDDSDLKEADTTPVGDQSAGRF